MKTIHTFIFIGLFLFFATTLQAQERKPFEGPRWRAGLAIQYSSNFKNLHIEYPALGYTGVLGGFSGRGLEIFGGYKVHKYVSIDVALGLLLNSYNRSYGNSIYIIGRFNKFYIQPGVKFIYPVLEKNFGTLNIFIGGGVGLNGSGRLYLEDNVYGDKFITAAEYDPMVAPFVQVGGELLFNDRSNLIFGFKYQNGAFNATSYRDDYNPTMNIKNAPEEIKTISAQGLGIMVGFIQEF